MSEMLSETQPTADAPMSDAPEWIRVAQDGHGMHGGFWTTAAATEASPKYIRADIASQEIDALKDEVARLRNAALHISPYLRWTISNESPGYHPTMPSAVAAFQSAFDIETARRG